MRKSNYHLLILGIIFFVGFILRFYLLGSVPSGLYQDETAIGYNAYSLLQTGKDEHGESWPLYFKSFGDYKLPIYIYSTVVSVSLFGLNEFAVRFPSAFFGFLTLIVVYILVCDLSKDKNLALLSTGLLAINPWNVHYNRATFEVSISLFLFLLGTYFLWRYFYKPFLLSFLFGTICFIVGLYTYNLTRLLAPVLYLSTVLFFSSQTQRKIKKKEGIATIIVGMLFLSPFLSTFVQEGGVNSASGTLIFSSAAVQAPLLEFRSYLIDLPGVFSKLFFNNFALTFHEYLKHIISYFSVNFLFLSGSTHGNHGIGNVGQFYMFEFVSILFGIVAIGRFRKTLGILLMIWLFSTVLVAALTREAPHATRSFFLIFPFVVGSAIGIQEFLKLLSKIRSHYLKYTFLTLAVLFAFYNFVYYLTSYYKRFPAQYASAWRARDKDVALFIKENETKYDKIIFDKDAGFIYSSLLFYLQYSPNEFLKTVQREIDDSEGFSNVRSFGKFEFRKIDWDTDLEAPQTLIITSEENAPKNSIPFKSFYYPQRPVVIAVKQDIVQYPIQDVAYVAFESKK